VPLAKRIQESSESFDNGASRHYIPAGRDSAELSNMEATDKNCPHCGYALTDGTTTCPCGLSLDDISVPGPGIVRDSLEQKLTLKSNEDGDLDEIEVEEIAPARDSAERKQGREGRHSSSESPASNESPRTAERARSTEEKSETKGSDDIRAVEISSTPEPAREPEPVPVRAKPAEKSAPLRAVRDASGQPRKNMIMSCPSCRARISKRAPKCPKCGQAPYRSCQICSSLILVNSAACGECGDPDPFLAQSA